MVFPYLSVLALSSLRAVYCAVGCGPLLIAISALFPPAKDPTAAPSPLGSAEVWELMSSTQQAMTVLG